MVREFCYNYGTAEKNSGEVRFFPINNITFMMLRMNQAMLRGINTYLFF
jgi:hypothetical protein